MTRVNQPEVVDDDGSGQRDGSGQDRGRDAVVYILTSICIVQCMNILTYHVSLNLAHLNQTGMARLSGCLNYV